MKNIRKTKNINIQIAIEKSREVKKAGAIMIVKIFNITKITEIIKILLLGAPLFLSGCMGMNSKFDCNIRPDGKCVPMGTIHQMADWGEFNERSNRRITEYNNLVKTNTNNKYPRQRYFSDASSTDPLFPPRSNEAIQKIWIGPYEDENGNYHEASNVYAVIKKARWLAEAEQTAKE